MHRDEWGRVVRRGVSEERAPGPDRLGGRRGTDLDRPGRLPLLFITAGPI